MLFASPTRSAETPSVSAPTLLQLEVTINGEPTHKVAGFVQLPDSHLAAKVDELDQIGVEVPTALRSEDIVPLSDIPGLRYNYDFARQSIDIGIPTTQLRPSILDARPWSPFSAPERTTGGYLNYSAFVAGNYEGNGNRFDITSGSLSLDGHIFGRFGSFSQSGIVGSTTLKDASVLRLDSILSYSDPDTITSYRGGDLISGGLAWSRPIRIAGLQIQRDFSIRPDLITIPLPSVSGNAAVPSTLDVYVGNAKTYSTEIPTGPYRIDNVPVVSGAGTARLVLTDATGRQSESQTPFFTDARLMRKGLLSYSLEAGFPRQDYGLRSNAYEASPVAVGSARAGLTDSFTVEGHAELGQGLANIGIGSVFSAGQFGLFSGAVGLSSYKSRSGGLLYGGWYLPFGNFDLQVSTRRTLGDYQDLASLPRANTGPFPVTQDVTRAVDQLSVAYRIPEFKTSINFTAVRIESVREPTSTIFSMAFSQTFANNMSLFATGFGDLNGKDSFGISIGLAIPLGPSLNSYAGVTHDSSGSSVSADLQKTIGSEPGSYGGRLSINQGPNSYVSGYGALKLSKGVAEASLTRSDSAVNGYLAFNGALVAAGDGLFASQRIDDAFAVVDAGAPGVKVLLENRPVGETGSNGELLVTGLRSFQKNKISIDAQNLPVDYEIPKTATLVVPADRSGVVAQFGIEQSPPSAVVIFVDENGSYIEPGTQGTLVADGETFIVGYDGRTFIKNLKAQNFVTIDLPPGGCRAGFLFKKKPNAVAEIGPVRCERPQNLASGDAPRAP